MSDTPTLSQLSTQVNLLYSSCNSVSQSVQQLLESQITYSNQVTQLLSEVDSLSSQQTTDIGNINLLNSEVAQLIYYQNLSILSQNNTTFNAATLSNSTDTTASAPVSLSGSISGNITYSIIGNSQYNKIIYYFNNYQSDSQTLPFPNTLLSPLANTDNITSNDYSLSNNELTINQTTAPLNGTLVVEGLVSSDNLAPTVNAPTSGTYQTFFINIGQYKKYLIYLNNYVNDSGSDASIPFALPFSITPFFSNTTNNASTAEANGITIPSSSNIYNGYFIAEGW